jgi:O-antigen ligase
MMARNFTTLEQPPTRWERVFFVVAMSMYNAVPFLVGDQGQGAEALNPVKTLSTMSTQGDAIKQLMLMGIYFVCVLVLIRTTRLRTWSFLGLPLIVLSGWGMMSMLWSFDPSVTLRRSIAMLGTVAFGTYIGLRFDIPTMLRLMSWVTAITLVSSIVVAFVWPNLGLDFEGRLRGVTAHKNAISGFASIVFLMLVFQLTNLNQNNWFILLWITGLATLCIVCMVWSESAAAVPVLLIGLPLVPIANTLRKADRSVTAIIPLLIGLCALLLLVLVYNIDSITEMLGKDTDMSGRTSVWAYAIKMFFEQFWLGYGYGTFWEGYNSPGGAFWSITGIGAPHSHNGYIELALDTGVIGLGLFAWALFLLVYRLAWLIRYSNDRVISWSVAYVGLFLVTNLSETRLWVNNSPFTVFFVYIVIVTNLGVWRLLCRNQPRDRAYTTYGAHQLEVVQ